MEQALQNIIANNGQLEGAREHLINHVQQFPTYDLITKDYLNRNPHLKVDDKK